jgi:hypothetical protein
MSVFVDLQREISGLLSHRAPKVEIRTGSAEGLAREFERQFEMKSVEGTSAAMFAGVPVIEDDLVPSNMAVVVSNGQIINMLKFGPEPTTGK